MRSFPPPADAAIERPAITRQKEPVIRVIHRHGGGVASICDVAGLEEGTELPWFVVIAQAQVEQRVGVGSRTVLAVHRVASGDALYSRGDPEAHGVLVAQLTAEEMLGCPGEVIIAKARIVDKDKV